MYKLDKNIIWLLRGSQRKEVFLNLPKDPFMSNKLRKELNEKKEASLSLREMSRHLRDFEEKGLVSQAEHTMLVQEDGCEVLTRSRSD